MFFSWWFVAQATTVLRSTDVNYLSRITLPPHTLFPNEHFICDKEHLLYMSGKPGFRVPRTATRHDQSVTVCLPKRELKLLGVDPEELVGEDLVCNVDEDEVSYELP